MYTIYTHRQLRVESYLTTLIKNLSTDQKIYSTPELFEMYGCSWYILLYSPLYTYACCGVKEGGWIIEKNVSINYTKLCLTDYQILGR